jgi:hypothetical protein
VRTHFTYSKINPMRFLLLVFLGCWLTTAQAQSPAVADKITDRFTAPAYRGDAALTGYVSDRMRINLWMSCC